MQTTALVVEILVIGLLALIGLVLVYFGISGMQPQGILKILIELKDYMAILILVVFAVSYQLGWLVNSIAYYFVKHTYMESVRSMVLGQDADNYDHMRDVVYANASNNAVAKVKERMSEVRISRTGVLNILMIGLGCYLLGWKLYATLLVILSLFMYVASRFAYKDYLKRIKHIYDDLSNKNKIA